MLVGVALMLVGVALVLVGVALVLVGVALVLATPLAAPHSLPLLLRCHRTATADTQNKI